MSKHVVEKQNDQHVNNLQTINEGEVNSDKTSSQ